MSKSPIQIYILFHKDFKEGLELAEYIFIHLSGNPDKISNHDIQMPVYFRCLSENEEYINYKQADKTVIIPIIDMEMVEDKRWIKYINDIFQNENKTSFIPISFTMHFGELNEKFNKINVSTIKNKPYYAENKDYFLTITAHETAKILYEDSFKESVNLFLSHTKRDNYALKITEKLKYIIQNETTSSVFFDKNSIHIGNDFWEEIEKDLSKKSTFLVIVLSDSYSESSWCRKEVLKAKENNIPFILINILDKKEERSFPYIGNSKVIRLDKKEDIDYYKIITGIYLETIKHRYNTLKLDEFEKKKYNIFPKSPELLDISLKKLDCNEIIMYPDPPLSEEELDLFVFTKKKLFTPMTYLKFKKNEDYLTDKKIMFSISETEDYQIYPMRNFIIQTLKYFFYYNSKILYGGILNHPKDKFNMLKQMLNSLDLYKKINSVELNKKIINYVSYPYYFQYTNEDKDIFYKDIKIEKISKKDISKDDYVDLKNNKTEEHENLSKESLIFMRDRITSDTDIVIVAGGKFHKDKIPGILEEFIIASTKKKPIFIIGSFGGVSKEIINIILGKESEKLSKYLKEINKIKKNKFNLLNNGLTKEENTELFKTEDGNLIVDYILKGLSNLSEKRG